MIECQVILWRIVVQKRTLEQRVNALNEMISCLPLRDKNEEVFRAFYEQLFDSFGFSPTDNTLYKKGTQILDVSKIDPKNFDLQRNTAREIEAKCGIAAVNVFNGMLHLQGASHLEKDLHYLMNIALDEVSELHPEAVLDYFEKAIKGKKASFQFLNEEERKLVLSMMNNAQFKNEELISFINLWKDKKINPNLLEQISQEARDQLLATEYKKIKNERNIELIAACIYAGGDFTNFPGILLWAAEYRRTEIVKATLSSPKCTEALLNNKDNNGYTALHLAAERIPVMVSYILESPHCTKALLNEKGNDGCTALDLAVQYGHTEIIKALIKKGLKLRWMMHYVLTIQQHHY